MRVISPIVALSLVVGTLQNDSSKSPVLDDEALIEQAESRLAEVRLRVEVARGEAEAARLEKLNKLRALEESLDNLEAESRQFAKAEGEAKVALASSRGEFNSLQRVLEDVEARLKKGSLDLGDRLEGSLIGLEFPRWKDESRALSEESGRSLEDRLKGFLGLLTQEIAQSSIASEFKADVLLPTGKVAEADVIRLGLVEGYFSRDDTRGGLYPSSDGRHFRGVEFADMSHDRSLKDVYTRDSGESLASIPIDPSGGLAAYHDISSRSFKESFDAGGIIMWPLAILAGLALVLFAERLFFLMLAGRGVKRVVDPVKRMAFEGRHDEAVSWLQGQRGPACRVLLACLQLRRAPPEVVDRGIEEAMLAEIPRLERSLGTLGTLGAIAPFLGLLGTITGMIKTFNVITAAGGNDPTLLSGGISEALLTTQAGLVVAIPILLLHTLLSGRVDSLIGRIEQAIAGVTATFSMSDSTSQHPRPSDPRKSEDDDCEVSIP